MSNEENASAQIWATKRYYEEHIDEWMDRNQDPFVHFEECKYLLSRLPSSAGRVIDIGCASGIHVPLFLGIGRHLAYTGVDLSEQFIEIAKQRYPQLDFLVGDVSDIDTLPRGPFDAFWCAATLMHVPRMFQDLALTNIIRICRPGAYGYVTLPQKHPFGGQAGSDPRHFEVMGPEEQRQLLVRHGWKIRVDGVKDGFYEKNVWSWYIVQLPK